MENRDAIGSCIARSLQAKRLAGSWLAAAVLACPAAAVSQLPTGERLVWRGLLGEAGVEIRSASGVVLVGMAGDSASVSVTLRASDVRRFADSLARRLARTRTRDSSWSLRLDEPGVSAGTLSLSPAGLGRDKRRQYRLFVADDVITHVQQVLDVNDVRLFARKLREAAGPAPRASQRRRR